MNPSDREELWDKILGLEAELKKKDELLFAYESVQAPVNPLLAKNKRLREALVKYGDHETGCMKGDACNCGFEQVLKQ